MSPSDIDDELLFHIESRVDELMARGIALNEARRAALSEFGDWRRYRQDTLQIDRQRVREVRMREFLDSVLSDAMYAWRGLRRTPAFTGAAILTLALGIGATTAVFGAVSGVLLRQLPFPDPARIVHVGEGKDDARPGRGGTTSFENFDDWRRISRSFASMGLYSTSSATLTGRGDPERVEIANVTSGMFDVFGIKPFIGRSLTPSDEDLDAAGVALLRYDFWRDRFGSDPSIVGQTLQFNFIPVRVVGVLPPGFRPPRGLSRPVWGNFINNSHDGRSGRSKNVYARLAPHVTIAQASAEMRTVAADLAEVYPRDDKGRTIAVDAASDFVFGDVRKPLYLLLGASALVLLIACANLSNLLLARGLARGREIAVRSAIGAGRGRIARQLLTESFVLSIVGSGAGLVLAYVATHFVTALGPDVFRDRPPVLDGRVLAFTISVSLLTTVLFGLAPTLRLARKDTPVALRDGGTRLTKGHSGRTRGMLAVTQLSLAVVLLSASALVIKSFARILRIEPGVNGDHVLTANITLPGSRYDSLRSIAFYDQLLAQVRAVPGVRGAAMTSLIPFSGDFDRVNITKIGGRPELIGADAPNGDRYVVTPSYFATMGIRLVRGRLLSTEDRYDAPVVCVVDEVLAHNVFGDVDPIGQTMKLPQRDESARIIGVVTHVKTYGLDVRSPGQIYISNAQFPWRWLSIVARTTGDPLLFAPTLARVVHQLDADQPVSDVNSMERQMGDLLRSRRFTLVLLGVFAGVAIALGAIGLYGVVAYGVSQRRRELGVRVALGAQRRQIAIMVVSEGARIALGGVFFGSVGALAAGRVLSSMLFEVSPRDPVILAAVGALLMGVAVVASAMPARRATLVSASEVLRGD